MTNNDACASDILVNVRCDGPTGSHCRITDAATERPITGVTKLSIHIEAAMPTYAVAEFFIAPPELKNVPLSVSREHLEKLAAAHGLVLGRPT